MKEEKLEIKTFGKFAVIRDGQVLNENFTRSTKVWTLFTLLLVYKNKNISINRILEALFDEEECHDPRNALQNYVYRLKKLLFEGLFSREDTPLVFINGGYRLETGKKICLDAELFENCFIQAETVKPADPEQAIGLYRRALRLYEGPYLPEYGHCDWVLPIRAYYSRLYGQCCLSLIELLDLQSGAEEILEVCQVALGIDPYHEGLNLCYLNTLLSLERTRDAHLYYESLTYGLYQELGLPPSPEMRRLYRKMKGKLLDLEVSLWGKGEEAAGGPDRDRALVVEPRFFQVLYAIEKRRAERSRQPVFLAVITLVPGDRRTSPRFYGKLREEAQNKIISLLRKGDVLTLWGECRYLILLSGLTETQARGVLDRIGGCLKVDRRLGKIRLDLRLSLSICKLSYLNENSI